MRGQRTAGGAAGVVAAGRAQRHALGGEVAAAMSWRVAGRELAAAMS